MRKSIIEIVPME